MLGELEVAADRPGLAVVEYRLALERLGAGGPRLEGMLRVALARALREVDDAAADAEATDALRLAQRVGDRNTEAAALELL